MFFNHTYIWAKWSKNKCFKSIEGQAAHCTTAVSLMELILRVWHFDMSWSIQCNLSLVNALLPFVQIWNIKSLREQPQLNLKLVCGGNKQRKIRWNIFLVVLRCVSCGKVKPISRIVLFPLLSHCEALGEKPTAA